MKYRNVQNAFSLMEMMVVLLIVSIIAAATAPMVTKKMARSAGSGDSPWVFTGLGGSIAYNMSGNKNDPVIIGAMRYNANNSGVDAPRLVVAGGDGLAFADNNGKFTSRIMISDTSVAINDAGVGTNSVAIGMGQTFGIQNLNVPNTVVAIGKDVKIVKQNSTAIGYLSNTFEEGATALGIKAFASGKNSIAIGFNRTVLGGGYDTPLQAKQEDSIAIGTSALARGVSSIAIGADTETGNNDSNFSNEIGKGAIAIGNAAKAKLKDSIAIGNGAKTFSPKTSSADKDSKKNAIAIGTNAQANHNNSVAIGAKAYTIADNQIVLGTANDTVYIPGHLVVRGDVALGSYPHKVYISTNQRDEGKFFYAKWMCDDNKIKTDKWYSSVEVGGISYSKNSDRRLKNVGEKYTAGLDELKKLDLYHYTFKKDEKKTPMVGVMAQDLQKVFPDAVTKGDDGYLRIRLEDMFYAVINAVKELDNKVSEIIANISGINSKVENLQKENAQLQKENSELKAEIKDIEKRIEKLESLNNKKLFK